jgi:hypothetical protein
LGEELQARVKAVLDTVRTATHERNKESALGREGAQFDALCTSYQQLAQTPDNEDQPALATRFIDHLLFNKE